MLRDSVGPDVAIVGAARSGTSLLAAQLGTHPSIDPSAVKEPNYFSRHYERGPSWYDNYFESRSSTLFRLDASASYTYPQFPDALRQLAKDSPSAFVVYLVREPIGRAVSHYLLYRHYFEREDAATFGDAIRQSSYYTDVSDYGLWLERLAEDFPAEQILVVPFGTLIGSSHGVANLVCAQLGLGPIVHATEAIAHQNNVVHFRNDRIRRMTRTMRQSALYPRIRRILGPNTLRRIRAAVTSVPDMPTTDEALSSCSADQVAQLHHLRESARASVESWIERQNKTLGIDWVPDEWQ